MRVRFLAPLFMLSMAAQGCFQTNCPDTKNRLLEHFNPGSTLFDPDLLSPPPLGSTQDDIQAIIETNPSRCVNLSDEFRQSAIDGIAGEPCAIPDTDCNGLETCRITTASTPNEQVLACRQNCSGPTDDTCPVGTACIQVDEDGDNNFAEEDFRCDNPNLGFCQAILRELGEPRCVACDELELLTCECRSGASSFACFSGIIDRELIIKNEANNICSKSFPDQGQEQELQDCVDEIIEPNSREERLGCTGIKANIAVLEDGITTDCSKNSFLIENGLLCGNEQECFGGRCEFLSIDEFNGTTPLDPIRTKVCSADCGDADDQGVLQPNPERCEVGFFCSENIRDIDGSRQDPGCLPVENANSGFSPDFDDVCDIADPNSCKTASCKILTDGNNTPHCTIPCTNDDQCGTGSTCIDTNPASGEKFCSQR